MTLRIKSPIIVDMASDASGKEDAEIGAVRTAHVPDDDLRLVLKLVGERVRAEFGPATLVPVIVTYSQRERKVAKIIRVRK